MYIKIRNLIQENGNADYKGLDINKIKNPFYDFENNLAYVEYNEEYSTNNDLLEITEEQVQLEKLAIENRQPLTLEERITATEQALNILLGL